METTPPPYIFQHISQSYKYLFGSPESICNMKDILTHLMFLLRVAVATGGATAVEMSLT